MNKFLKNLPDWGYCIAFTVLSAVGFWWFEEAKWILPTSIVATCAIALLIKISIVREEHNFSDFFKGENNTYSLSRLQFFLWVLIIIASQIAIISILVKEHALDKYNLVVGEHVLWILAASFGTLLSVQGIATQKKNAKTLKRKDEKNLKDLIVDNDRLDFTRFQMLMWTAIAIGVYYFQTVSYINDLRTSLLDVKNEIGKAETLKEFNSGVSLLAAKVEVFKNNRELSARDSFLVWNDSIVQHMRSLQSKELIDKESAGALIFERDVIKSSSDTTNTFFIAAETKFIQNVQQKTQQWLANSANELKATEDKIAAAFIEADGEKSPIPDISLTFLILMGLVQGAYVGKKLLPVDESGNVTTTLPGTYVPKTEEGKKAFDELKLKEAFELAKAKFLPKPYVTGVDIGLKKVDGKLTDQKVIRIHVSKKILDPTLIDEPEKIPSEINGVPTDVIESNFSQQSGGRNRKKRLSPLQPGISVGDDFNTGTLGLIVTDTLTGDPCVLSNHHVLKSDSAYQPGLDDGGKKPADKIGEKVRSIKSETGDAAIYRITDTSRTIDKKIFGTNTTLVDTKYPVISTALKKSGKETGVTKGIVTSDIGVYKIKNSDYRVNGFLIAAEDGTPVTVAGDSGSVWFDETTSDGVGLHIGLSENGTALACLLTDVLIELKAKI